MVWLGLAAKNFYAKHIGFLMKTNVNWAAAILFYLLFIAGLVVSSSLRHRERLLARALLFGHYSVSLPMRPTISRISPRSRTGPGGDGGRSDLGYCIGCFRIRRNLRRCGEAWPINHSPMNYYRTLAFVLWGYMTLWFLISWFKKGMT